MHMINFKKLIKYKLTRQEFKAFVNSTKEHVVTEEATRQIITILESNYSKANLKRVIKGATHLNEKQKNLHIIY